MRISQKNVFDAGITSTTSIADTSKYLTTSGIEISTPRSSYSIKETTVLPVTNKIVGFNQLNMDLADGERRPGTRGK